MEAPGLNDSEIQSFSGLQVERHSKRIPNWHLYVQSLEISRDLLKVKALSLSPQFAWWKLTAPRKLQTPMILQLMLSMQVRCAEIHNITVSDSISCLTTREGAKSKHICLPDIFMLAACSNSLDWRDATQLLLSAKGITHSYYYSKLKCFFPSWAIKFQICGVNHLKSLQVT